MAYAMIFALLYLLLALPIWILPAPSLCCRRKLPIKDVARNSRNQIILCPPRRHPPVVPCPCPVPHHDHRSRAPPMTSVWPMTGSPHPSRAISMTSCLCLGLTARHAVFVSVQISEFLDTGALQSRSYTRCKRSGNFAKAPLLNLKNLTLWMLRTLLNCSWFYCR
jgi:hypothetical protein